MDGLWRCVSDSTWNRSYSVIGGITKPPGTYTIEFEPLSLLVRPSSISGVSVSSDGTVSYTRGYLLTDVYVNSTTGSDSNNGTSSQPFATIQHALGEVAPNGDIWLENPNYYEALNYPTDRTIHLKNGTGGVYELVRLYNTWSKPGNVDYTGVAHQGMSGF